MFKENVFISQIKKMHLCLFAVQFLSLFLSLSLSLSHIDHLYDLRVLVTELQAVTTIKLSGKWSLTSFSKT